MIVLPARIWAKIEKTDNHWLWTGATDKKDYGRVWFEGRLRGVHRLTLAASGVAVPDHLQVDHHCHVHRCCRPDHLRVATNQVNNLNRKGANSNSISGIRGVGWHTQNNNWRVRLQLGGRSYSGGSYDDLAEAETAAIALRERLGV